MKKTVITYGTFDLFHIGHLRLLERLSRLGDSLIVAVSSDDFNAEKGKKTIIGFEERAAIVGGLRCVDLVIAETSWAQKEGDIRNYGVSILGMGDDWRGKFDQLKPHCEVVYLPRTQGVSSTQIKAALSPFDRTHIQELRTAIDTISTIVDRLNDE
jgi:glycerol-3-phosphate cytidylyltransferase